MKKVLVCGSRTFDDYEMLARTLDEHKIGTIICGDARGADTLAKHYAKERGINLIEVRADWSRGKQAGPVRNQRMIDMWPELVIAFWDGRSRGTKDTLKRAERNNIARIIVPVHGGQHVRENGRAHYRALPEMLQ